MTAEEHPTVRIYRVLCTHSSADGHGCFHPLATVNNASVNTGIQASVWVPVFSYLGHRPRSGTAEPDGNSTFSFWRNLPNILFSFFLSSLVWNQLLSGSGFGASFPFSRSRCAVLICGDSRRMKPMSDNTEYGDCRKPWPANAWDSDGTFGRHSPSEGRPAGACVVCSLSGLTWASDFCISFSSASNCRTAYTSFSIFSILSRNLRMTSQGKRTKEILK